MNIIFSKKQLKLMEGMEDSSNKPALALTNNENDNDTSSLQQQFSKLSQSNTNGADIVTNTSEWTSKKNLSSNPTDSNKELTIKNNPGAASEMQKIINTSNPATMPSKIRITNGINRGNNLVEVTTFSKKDLDKFLKSL